MNLETFTPTESTNQPLTRANIEKLLQEVASSDKLDLSGQNMRGIDLSELDLRGRANLCRALLLMANVREATLEYANLSGACMSRANLLDATLEYANLSGAILKDAYLYETERDSLVNRGINDLAMVRIVS